VRFEVLDQGIAYLSRLAVDPDIQSIGIGGLLLEKVRQECVNLGVRAITLHTASKMRSFGFVLPEKRILHTFHNARQGVHPRVHGKRDCRDGRAFRLRERSREKIVIRA